MQAKDAYDKAIKLEPSDESLRSMRYKAEVNEAKQEADKTVKFKQSRQRQKTGAASNSAAAVKNKALLSFDVEDE